MKVKKYLTNQTTLMVNALKTRKKVYKAFLKSHKLASSTFNYASEVDKKNILLKNFDFLLRLSNQKVDKFIDHMNVLRLLSSELFYLSSNSLDAEVAIQLDETVIDILDHLNIISVGENLEYLITKDYKFSPEDNKQYFNFHKIYSNLAATFAAPFIHLDHYFSYYSYGYYLSMFLNLHYFANEETILADSQLFLTKLRVQEKMIEAIRMITPDSFNSLILKTNSWIKRINFKKLNKEVKI